MRNDEEERKDIEEEAAYWRSYKRTNEWGGRCGLIVLIVLIWGVLWIASFDGYNKRTVFCKGN